MQVSQGNNSGCLALFGIPFVGFGVFFAIVSARLLSDPRAKNPLIGVVFGGVFALIGLAMMVGGFYSIKANRRMMGVRAANPQQPWMWDANWAQGRAVGQSGGAATLGWMFALIWNGISWPAAILAWQKPIHGKDRVIYAFLGIFLIIGAFLLVNAVIQTLRRMRYGKTFVQLQTLPAPLGRKLKGTIEVNLPYPLPHGINLAFSCVNRVVTQSGKDRNTTDYIRWQERKNLAAEQVVAGPMGTTIPIEFDVPRDMPATNHDNPNNQMLWMLRAEADVPGVNYDESYEVPVFETRESPGLQDWRATQDEQERLHPATAPLRPRVQVSAAPEGGMQFYYGAMRSPVSALVLSCALLVFGGADYLIITEHGPTVLAVIFSIFAVLLFVGTLNAWFGTARIVANGNGVLLHTSTLGIGGTKLWATADIDSIYPKVTMQTSGARGTAWYTVTLRDAKGREFGVGKQIKDHNEAEWICEQMKQLASVRTRSAAGSR